MKKRITPFIFVISLICMILACSGDGSSLMKSVTGKPGETVVVISKELWSGDVGDTISRYLSQPQLCLPQEEPILTVVNVPPDAFKTFETTRNIVLTRILPSVTEPSVTIQYDVWAKPQVVVSVQAPDEAAFIKIFAEKSDMIIATILRAEKMRLMAMYAQSKYKEETISDSLIKKHRFNLNIPRGYDIVKDTSDFVWIRYESPLTSQGILAYWYPYVSDSAFATSSLLHKRDSILRRNVPGALPGSFMSTEKRFIVSQIFKNSGNYSVEIRGLWKVEGDFMGGPFVSLSTLDLAHKRVITVEGYLYSPKYNKRDYLRQVEAMIYSLSFPDQKLNDKINEMYLIGEPLPKSGDSPGIK
ncbi:MAG: DUF4837 family protein [Bacteroidia bacterium]|nr:DUF4837 family protein [Bacteroidia bacterium]